MQPVARTFIALGSINAALAVILGAFGAHALKARISPEMLSVYHTASQYHFYHALGMLLIGALASQFRTSGALQLSGFLMLAGIVLFSGSLYILAVTGVTWLGAVTPLGGVAFIAAWAVLAYAAMRATV
ncbi:MAG TPA: DUF423 domain-containing protein [Gemmatimonadaceae bacterium]|nr:DUF423 domain-containing protein [Gemmatimonadaceae bacterium]